MGVIEKSNTYTYGDLSIGQRISELMEERGSSYSLRAFGGRIGISKDMLGRMISGERHITPSELERIASGFKLSPERVKQEDTKGEVAELKKLLYSKANPKRAVTLAQSIAAVAQGISERCLTFDLLGQAYFLVGELDQAHTAWLQALTYAEKIEDRYGEASPLYAVLNNLTVTFTERKEYAALTEILDRIEPVFQTDLERLGGIYYSRAMIATRIGDPRMVGDFLSRSLESLIETGIQDKIGRAQLNLGYYEYQRKNYVEAKHLLEQAIENLSADQHYLPHAFKEYAKVLIKLGETEKAVQLCEAISPQIQHRADLHARFMLLLAIAKQDATIAEDLFSKQGTDPLVRRLACDFLMNYYASVGNAPALLKYFQLSKSNADVLDEEEL